MSKDDKIAKRIETRPQLLVAELPKGREIQFELVLDNDQRTAGAVQLGILDLHRVRFTGKLSPLGKADWELNGMIGATVTQACVVTLQPVKTRIDEPVHRVFLANWDDPVGESVREMDEDVESEALGEELDLENVALEAISLAMPDYPRLPDAELPQAVFTEPGQKAMTDEEAKPFAALAALKDKLGKS